MKFIIDPRITTTYPRIQIETVILNDLQSNLTDQSPYDLLQARSQLIQQQWTIERIESEPVFQRWCQVYQAFGAKPRKHRCSVENLYRMIVEGNVIKQINPIVDAYNYISLKYLIPVGGDDLSNVIGDIQLTIADGTESFTPLNGTEVTHPKPGEIIYRDAVNVLCRRWNWRECDQTKITERTSHVILYLEDLGVHSTQHLSKAAAELRQLLS